MAEIGAARQAEFPAGTLHYHEAGDGPPLILLHGSGPGVSGLANFAGVLPRFAAHFRTIVPDLPGYGATPASLGAAPPQTVEVVIGLLDRLGIDRAHLIGNSFGAIVGAMLAAQRPERIDRFVAIGGIGFYPLSPFPGEGLTRLVEFTEDPTRDKLAAWLRSMVFDERLVTEELIESRFALATRPDILAASRQVYSRAAFAALLAHMRGAGATQGIAHLSSIAAPTLLAWGRDDRVNPLDGALVPMRLIPNCELHVFPNCGHWAMIEQRAAFESVVLAFLTRDG